MVLNNNIKNVIKHSKEIHNKEIEEVKQNQIAHDNIKKSQDMPELVIITGISGAGRTEAMHVVEDLGYFCIDNLPSFLLTNLILKEKQNKQKKLKIAVVCDTRSGEYFNNLLDEIEKIEKLNIKYNLIFLEASDDKLIARYKSSRRRHPMCSGGETIIQGIYKERNLLYNIREKAHYIIDTSDMLPQEFRESFKNIFNTKSYIDGLSITVYSFGFKNYSAYDADLVIDVRFLPNPYWDPEMRKLTGLDSVVHDFVMGRSQTQDFIKKWYALLDTLIPGYIKEGKQQLAIAIGCTGGQHRSVTLAEETGEYLKSQGYRVSIAHRDLAMNMALLEGSYKEKLNFSNSLSQKLPRVTSPGSTGSWKPI